MPTAYPACAVDDCWREAFVVDHDGTMYCRQHSVIRALYPYTPSNYGHLETYSRLHRALSMAGVVGCILGYSPHAQHFTWTVRWRQSTRSEYRIGGLKETAELLSQLVHKGFEEGNHRHPLWPSLLDSMERLAEHLEEIESR